MVQITFQKCIQLTGIIVIFLSILTYSNPVDSLYGFRRHFADLTEPCGYSIGTRKFDCGPKRFETIRAYLDKSIEDWRKNEHPLCEMIFNISNSYIELEKIKGRVIHDSILAYSICIILQYDTLFGGYLARPAYSTLMEDMPYSYLRRHYPLIKNIRGMKTFDQKDKDRLLALCSPDKATAERLLKEGEIGPEYRARLASASDSVTVPDPWLVFIFY